MEVRDWIALVQAVILSGAGIYFAIRLEKIRKLYARNLKRYDLLHTARFNALEKADDALVEVQKAEYDAWKQVHRGGPATEYQRERTQATLDQLRVALQAAAIAKVKCEKYFDEDFNREFATLLGKLQDTEMRMIDVAENNRLSNGPQLGSEKISRMNEAATISKAAIPAFRKKMGVIIQEDVGQ